MHFNKLVLLTLIAMIAACAPNRSDDPPASPPPLGTHAKVLSSCDSNKAQYLDRNDLVEEAPVSVAIERHLQRVIRLDCQGKVTRDQIETVRSPRADVSLKPSRRLSKKAGFVRLLNSETCDYKLGKLPSRDFFVLGQLFAITGANDGAIKVKMDMAEALFTYKMTTGLNRVFYSYYTACDNPSVSDCVPKEEILAGVFNILVTYSEKNLSGSTTVPALDCEKSSK